MVKLKKQKKKNVSSYITAIFIIILVLLVLILFLGKSFFTGEDNSISNFAGKAGAANDDWKIAFPPDTYQADIDGDCSVFGAGALSYWNTNCCTIRATLFIGEGGGVSIQQEYFIGPDAIINQLSAIPQYIGNIKDLSKDSSSGWRERITAIIDTQGTVASFTCEDDSDPWQAGGIQFKRVAAGNMDDCDVLTPDKTRDKCETDNTLWEMECPYSSRVLTSGDSSSGVLKSGDSALSESFDIKTCRCENNACQGPFCEISGKEVCIIGDGDPICDQINICSGASNPASPGHFYYHRYCNEDNPGDAISHQQFLCYDPRKTDLDDCIVLPKDARCPNKECHNTGYVGSCNQ